MLDAEIENEKGRSVYWWDAEIEDLKRARTRCKGVKRKNVNPEEVKKKRIKDLSSQITWVYLEVKK